MILINGWRSIRIGTTKTSSDGNNLETKYGVPVPKEWPSFLSFESALDQSVADFETMAMLLKEENENEQEEELDLDVKPEASESEEKNNDDESKERNNKSESDL